jgi:hypothetical protein
MVMVALGGGKSLGSLENSVMLGNDRLKIMVQRGCLNCLNGMELGNDARMTFFEFLFHAVGTDDFWRACCSALEFILLSSMLKLHG